VYRRRRVRRRASQATVKMTGVKRQDGAHRLGQRWEPSKIRKAGHDDGTTRVEVSLQTSDKRRNIVLPCSRRPQSQHVVHAKCNNDNVERVVQQLRHQVGQRLLRGSPCSCCNPPTHRASSVRSKACRDRWCEPIRLRANADTGCS
jgi:hypothetical protein